MSGQAQSATRTAHLDQLGLVLEAQVGLVVAVRHLAATLNVVGHVTCRSSQERVVGVLEVGGCAGGAKNVAPEQVVVAGAPLGYHAHVKLMVQHAAAAAAFAIENALRLEVPGWAVAALLLKDTTRRGAQTKHERVKQEASTFMPQVALKLSK